LLPASHCDLSVHLHTFPIALSLTNMCEKQWWWWWWWILQFYQWRRQRSKGARSFQVRKSSRQVTRMHFFPQKQLTTFFSCRPQNTGRQRRFTVKIKQIKRSDMVTFLSSVHTITEAKHYAGLDRVWARAVDFPARSCDLARPGVAPPEFYVCNCSPSRLHNDSSYCSLNVESIEYSLAN